MRISDSLVEQLLLSHELASQDQLVALREREHSKYRPLQDLAVSEGFVSEEALTKLYADEIGVPYIDLSPRQITHEHLGELPERLAQRFSAIVFAVDTQGVRLVAMANPTDEAAVSFLHKQLAHDLQLHIASESRLRASLEQYQTHRARQLQTTAAHFAEAATARPADPTMVAETLDAIIEHALREHATDIHLEPRDRFLAIRYRIDGALHEVHTLPLAIAPAIARYSKQLAGLALSAQSSPQMGSFQLSFEGQNYLIAVSTVPVLDGEKVVLRIRHENPQAPSFTKLGLWGDSLTAIHSAIVEPHGLLVVTGPSGAGKSTTVLSMLAALSSPNVNIATIEDPISYRLPGANQTAVDPKRGIDYPNGLAALLEQDPNIIMVGEIRDKSTAKLSIKATTQGHLLVTTIPASGPATALAQLSALDVEPYLVANSLRIVINQRLIRLLCSACAEAYVPTAAQLKRLAKSFALERYGGFKQLHAWEAQAIASGLTTNTAKPDNSPHTRATAITKLYRASKHGCTSCDHTGYSGRIGIYSVLVNTPAVQQRIANGGTTAALQSAFIQNGMVSLQIDGLIKAVRGLTSIEEILTIKE